MKTWIGVVGGSVAALAATLHVVNAPALRPAGTEEVRVPPQAARLAPALPQRARLVRLEDHPGQPTEPRHSVTRNGIAGLLALLGLSTLGVASRRRLRVETT